MRPVRVLLTTWLCLAALACQGTPSLTYDPTDATTADAFASDASATDADTGVPVDASGGDDAYVPIGDFSDASDDASATCGSATVSSCAACPGNPILCAKNGTSTCVSDCSECAPGTLACTHCVGNATLARCVALNNKGVLPCNGALRCSCDADAGASSCPKVSGISEVCSTAANKPKCLTCGEKLAMGMACVTARGAQGTCVLDPAAGPICQ